MIRRRRIAGVAAVLLALLAPGAQAASPYARATLERCDRDLREAVFEGRVQSHRRAVKMQLRFTLQAQTRESRRWRKINAEGFGQWITAPAGVARYTYVKTVQELLAPAGYRTVVHFRWRDARGRLVRSERATSPVCRQPDPRPDLALRVVRHAPDGYVAVVANRGHEFSGAFEVSFVVGGEPLGTQTHLGLAPGESATLVQPGPPCRPGALIEAIVDPGAEIDEANEENDALSAACGRLHS
jgi:hypothetical protein